MQWFLAFTRPFAVLAVRPGVSSSRRALALALVVLIPFAGPLLAWIVRGVRGGVIAPEPTVARKRARAAIGDVRRLGSMPAAVERLLSKDPAERLTALVHLSSAGDANARAVLQWTIERGPTEVVLEAALTLEEIELRHAGRAAAAAPTVVRAPASPAAAPTKAPTLAPIGALARAA